MRKKQLIKQMELLVAKNNELYNDNVKLVSQISELKKELENLNNKISSSVNIVSNSNDTEPSIAVKPISQTEVNPVEVVADIVEENITTENIENVSRVAVDEIDLSTVCDGVSAEYATELIGKVVIRSATVCNTFAESGGQNAKDLINLAIGMTEVFKADALAIVTEEISDDDKNAKLLEKYNAAIEYFDLLLTQIA